MSIHDHVPAEIPSGDCSLYEYVPLQDQSESIRVLNLLPGESNSPLQIELEVVPFNEIASVCEYEALSYTWGTQTNPACVLVGTSSSKALPITRNLEEALLHLRIPDRGRLLWVDAVCINQSDVEEKGPQVARIADIFANATKVIAWIGPESDDSPLAMDSFELLNVNIKVDRRSWALHSLTNESDWADSRRPLPFNEKQISALYNFLNRPWFERMWVWPEVYSNSSRVNLMCGGRVIRWIDFASAFACLYIKPKPLFPKIPDLDRCLSDLGMLCIVQNFSFLGALQATRACKCSDPRDRIYAINALVAREWERLKLTPDYSKSTREVYSNAASTFVATCGSLDILKYGTIENNIPHLPSWAPDWSAPLSTRPFENRASLALRHFQNSTAGRSSHLRVKGLVVCHINAVEPYGYATEFAAPDSTLQSEISDFLHRITAKFPGTKSEEQLPRISRILAANDFCETRRDTNVTKPSLHDTATVISQLLTEGRADTRFSRTVCRAIEGYCRGRAFFTSTAGHVGLARADAIAGDIITVLAGCNAAVTLRPSGKGTYIVVGDAYCDGVMHGELLLGPLPEEYEMLYTRNDAENLYGLSTFRNVQTGEIELEDPRLGDLLPGWQRIHLPGIDSTPAYQHAVTGETRYDFNDLRLDFDVLEARGVRFQDFDLV